MRKTLFILFLILTWNLSAQQSLKIAVISDIHYLSPKLVSPSVALQSFEATTGRNTKELHEVLNQVFTKLTIYKPDILLISGDITNNGEKDSHIDFAAKLEVLSKNGTRIFVVPGNHDVNVPNAKAFVGDKPIPTLNISAQEFEEIYGPYGYADSAKRDSASLSYMVELNDSTWLLGIDSNRYKENTTTTIASGRILPETLRWTLDILNEANSKDILVLGMMHHGLVEHMPYQSAFLPQYLIDNWEENAHTLADNGLKIIFTGHFHSNDITSITSQKGNTIYDVETGSLAGYPFPYRLMTLQNNKLIIESEFVDSIPSKPNLKEESLQKTEIIIRRVVQSKIGSMNLPIPSEMKNAVIDLIVKMQLLHMKGDEKMDTEMRQMIEKLRVLVGDPDADFSSFELDFPPADNFLEIEL